MISLRSARGGDTRERYESALILHASRIDRLTDPFGRPVFSSSISCWRIPCRIVYLRYRGGDARLYRERGHGGMIAARFQALRNITSRIPLLRSSFYAGSNAFLHVFYRTYGLCRYPREQDLRSRSNQFRSSESELRVRENSGKFNTQVQTRANT